jgi:hypothetical protein
MSPFLMSSIPRPRKKEQIIRGGLAKLLSLTLSEMG